MKKWDRIILLSACVLCIGLAGLHFLRGRGMPGHVSVYWPVHQQWHVYPLEGEMSVSVGNGGNTVAIEYGEVYMKHADCPDQVCVRTGRISRVNQMITCLPNGVIVRIAGDVEGEELDSVAR